MNLDHPTCTPWLCPRGEDTAVKPGMSRWQFSGLRLARDIA